MNISQLQPANSGHVQRVSKEATSQDAEFLSFKLLNKRERVRLSPDALNYDSLPGKGELLAIANSRGWFAAVVRAPEGENIILSPLSDLQTAFSSHGTDGEIPFQPQRTIPLQGNTACSLTFAFRDARLIVGLVQGPIAVFDATVICSPGTGVVPPLRTFDPTSPGPIRQLAPNPGDIPEHVAILRAHDGTSDAQTVQVLDVQKLESVAGWTCGSSPDTVPTSLSWSPKGKQLAIGLAGGDIVCFAPSDTSAVKSIIPRPPSVENQSVISSTWLSSSTFHAIYAPAGSSTPDVEQTHFVLSLDAKLGVVTDVKLVTPYMTFPGLRPPGAFVATLRDWNPCKFTMVIGDSTSSDIGVIGSIGDASGDNWHNFSLEENATPSLPLDKEMNDTVLLGFDLDLTATQTYKHTGASGEESDLPPPPILYAYLSDGTLQAWHMVNSNGQSYPGMAAANAAAATAPPPAFASAIPAARGPSDSAMNESPITPAFGQTSGTGFGQTPASQTSAFGQSSFGQPSAFGQTSFGQAPSTGFGAFRSASPGKFGQTGFGFGAPPAPSNPTPAPALSEPAEVSMSTETKSDAPEDSMAEETPGFGGLSLGGDGDAAKKPSPFGSGSSGLFGQPAASTMKADGEASKPTGAFGNTGTSAFGSSGFSSGSAFRPAQGFGAFGATSSGASPFSQAASKPSQGFSAFSNLGQTTPAPPVSTTTAQPNTGSTFGKSTFGAAPAFGQSSFGSGAAPGFGQSSFGSGASAFGKPASGTSSGFGGSTSSGGFAAFAGDNKASGFASFASGGKSAFAQAPKTEIPVAPASGGGFSAFAGSGMSAFGPTTPKKDESPAASSTPAASPAPAGSTTPAATPPPKADAAPRGAAPISPADDTPPATPGASPVATPAKSPFSAFQSSNSFTSSSPGASGGAFGGLQSSPNVFKKPGEGFGAFGGSGGTSSSSPFFNAANAAKTGDSPTPVSIFGSGGSTTPTKPPTSAFPPNATPGSTPVFGQSAFSTTPIKTPPASAFGAPSTPGGKSVFGQSAFGQASTTPTSSPAAVKAPASGGFSAFTASGSTFGTTVEKGKSFGDLLRGEADAKGKEKAAEPALGGQASPDAHGQRASTKPLRKEESFDSLGSSFTEISHPSDEEADGPADQEAQDQEDDATSFVSEGFSDGEETLSNPDNEEEDGDGTEDVPEEGAEDDEEDEEDEEGEDEEAEEEEDLPEDPEDDGDESVQQEDGVDGAERRATPTGIFGKTPTSTPTPANAGTSTPPTTPPTGLPRSTAPAPQPTPPDVKADPAPATTTADAQNTTTRSPILSPSPVAFGGLGLGKPTTRPNRSSPLASAPISGEAPADDKAVNPLANAKARPASPKPAFGTWPAPTTSNQETSREKAFPGGAEQKAPTMIPFNSTTPAPSNTLVNPPASQAGVGMFGKPFAVGNTPVPASSSPSLFGKPNPPVTATAPTSSAFMAGNTAPAPPPSLFGKPAMAGSGPAAAPPLFTPNSFGSLPTFPAFPKATPSPTPTPLTGLASPSPPIPQQQAFGVAPSPPPLFGKPIAPQVPLSSAPPPAPTGDIFGKPSGHTPIPFGQLPPKPGASTTGAPSGIAGFTPLQVAPASPSVPPSAAAPQRAPASTPAPTPPRIEEGMQAECSYLFASLAKELEDLKVAARNVLQRKSDLGRSMGGERTTADLSDRSKWSLGDVTYYSETLKLVQKDVARLKEERSGLVRSLRQLESDMLKAGTRKEEIVRFNRARSDAGFAKMLKTRTLGPEHLETQGQLRRDIRNIRDRVEKLEGHLQSLKKRLASEKTGKMQLRAPSLDTINRTMRNIDIAIRQESVDINALTARVAKLDLDKARPLSTSGRDRRLPDESGKRPRQMTPSIAVSTASALNAERSAQKLKRALLAARKEPLLNTTVASAPVPPQYIATPGQPVNGGTPGLFSNQTTGSTDGLPEWALPSSALPATSDDTFAPVTPSHGGAGSGRRGGNSRHLKPVQLKKSPGPAATSSPAFNWGPLPTMNATPKTGLAFDLRASASPPAASAFNRGV